MDDFNLSVDYNFPAERLYDLLTTAVGIRSWYTPDCDIALEVGQRSTFRFGPEPEKNWYTVMVEKIIPDAEVHWLVTKQHREHPALDLHDEWVGTSMHFIITPLDCGRCRLDFTHCKLTAELQCCRTSIDHWEAAFKLIK